MLELRTETEEGLNRMQNDMDAAIEHLEMQLEDLRSKCSSIPLRSASELPFDGDSTHGHLVLFLATPPQKPKSESPDVCQHRGGNLFADPMVHTITPPVLSPAAPSSIPFAGQSVVPDTFGTSALPLSPDLSYLQGLPSFGSLPHQYPLDLLPATPPLRPLGFGGLGGSGGLGRSGFPRDQGLWVPTRSNLCSRFYGAHVTPPTPIPKVKVDAPDKFDGRVSKVNPSVCLTKVERWLRLRQIP